MMIFSIIGWGNQMDPRYQVFVSSTYSDLRSERVRIINELTKIGYIAAGMEQFPATDEEQMEYIRLIIDEFDYYVVIIKGKYGSVASDGISYTEKECEYALQKGKPVLGFLFRNPRSLRVEEIDDDPAKAANLRKFREKLERRKIINYWDTVDELASVVKESINDIARRKPGIGWVRGDKALDPNLYKELVQSKESALDDIYSWVRRKLVGIWVCTFEAVLLNSKGTFEIGTVVREASVQIDKNTRKLDIVFAQAESDLFSNRRFSVVGSSISPRANLYNLTIFGTYEQRVKPGTVSLSGNEEVVMPILYSLKFFIANETEDVNEMTGTWYDLDNVVIRSIMINLNGAERSKFKKWISKK